MLNHIQSPDTFSWARSNISFVAVLLAAVAYLAVVWLLTKSVKTPVAFLKDTSLSRHLVSVHNIILCLGSLYMFVFCFVEVVKRSRSEGVEWLFCESESTVAVGPLFYYSYLYHLSKYYELLDTFLQLLSGKIPPNFGLHVYHHAVIMVMTWLWLEHAGSLQFIGILFNTCVHVVMYYYYYLRSVGISPRWKSLVTKFQIIQFICSLLAFLTTMYFYFVRQRHCKGMASVCLSIAFNATLLYGFVAILSKSKEGKKEH
jgi:hypothetical protein